LSSCEGEKKLMSANSGRPVRDDRVVVLFHRDLRLHDHPALNEACQQAERVVPLFVLDPKLTGRPLASSNRLAVLLDFLRNLRRSLTDRGGQLYLRTGEPAIPRPRPSSWQPR
jgi:deoxyribodipyrimidine photo-lyase